MGSPELDRKPSYKAELGKAFLDEHGLHISPGKDFIEPDDVPYLILIDGYVALVYGSKGSREARVFDMKNSATNLLEMLGDEFLKLCSAESGSTPQGIFRVLPPNMAMPVSLESDSWKPVLEKLGDEFPYCITFA